MDSDEEGEEATFDNLDELVVFCMAHEMRVEGAEVQLRETVPCAEEAGGQVKAISFGIGCACNTSLYAMSTVTFGMPLPPPAAPRKMSRGEDSDQLTDLFATLFGARSTVRMGGIHTHPCLSYNHFCTN